MSYHPGRLAAFGVLVFLVATPSWAEEVMVPNPFYKFWASSQPGATAVHLEKTKLNGPEGKELPGGVDEKRIVYKLIEVDKDRVVVQMSVTERDLLGYVEAAPTRHIYPAQIEKSRLERILLEDASKAGEETVKVGDKEIKTRTVAGIIKVPDGEEVEFKLWLSEEVPGMIVKQVRTARQKGDVLAETTTTLESHKKGD
jgi:hypothetical protein